MIRCWLALVAVTVVVGAAIIGRDALRAARSAEAPPASDARIAGVTGTAALPRLPVPTALGTGDMPRPFSMAGTSASDRARALDCLASVIYYEAASEPDDGQRAVAQVVLNRVRHPAFPATVCGVVYQGADSGKCQFSFACDGAAARRTDTPAWTRAVRIAAAALAGDVFAPVGLATHYHTYEVTPGWNRGLVMTAAVGTHFFHRWKGGWGTAAAFTQPYRGGEPMPGATGATPLPAPMPAALPAPLAPPVIAVVTPAPVAAAPADRLPPASTILDKWKDSGQPLR